METIWWWCWLLVWRILWVCVDRPTLFKMPASSPSALSGQPYAPIAVQSYTCMSGKRLIWYTLWLIFALSLPHIHKYIYSHWSQSVRPSVCQHSDLSLRSGWGTSAEPRNNADDNDQHKTTTPKKKKKWLAGLHIHYTHIPDPGEAVPLVPLVNDEEFHDVPLSNSYMAVGTRWDGLVQHPCNYTMTILLCEVHQLDYAMEFLLRIGQHQHKHTCTRFDTTPAIEVAQLTGFHVNLHFRSIGIQRRSISCCYSIIFQKDIVAP